MLRVVGTLLVAFLLLVTAPAARAYMAGAGTAPTGDATLPGARDVVGLGLVYDPRAGLLEGSIALREPATAETDSFVTLFAGRLTATGCDGYPAVGFAADATERSVRWSRIDRPGQVAVSGSAAKTGTAERVQTFSITAPELRGQRPDCAVATLTEPRNPSVVFDSATISLRAQPLLAVKLGDIPILTAGGSTRAVRVTLSNTGLAPTASIRLRFSGARGVKVTSPKQVGPLPPGATRQVTVRLSPSRQARDATLTLQASAARLRARAQERYAVIRSSGGRRGGGGTPPIPSTCTRWSPDPFGDSGGSLILVPCTR